MRFKIDENLPIEVADLLRRAGHDAMTVQEQQLNGKSDARVISVCQEEQRALITCDVDFSNAFLYPPERYAGIIVLRLVSQDRKHILEVVASFLPLLHQKPLQGYLWIVEESRIRIRPGPPQS